MTFAVGDYQAAELLGTGASAQVWRGNRISTGDPVALKVFPPDQLPAVRREAALAAAVDHPHVVTVLDVVADDSRVALVTELASGGDLAELLARRGRLTPGQTLTVLIPLAAVLATAHERQIVHGDISAANIVFDGAGRPLLADLGAARAAMETGRPVQATPCDAAPELARSGPPTPATDLFSLGSVALACLAGRPAWPADDLRDVLIQAAAGQWPDLPDDAAPAPLVTAVRALLEHDPERRPGAASLVLDLRSAGRPEPLDLSPGRSAGAPPPSAAGAVGRWNEGSAGHDLRSSTPGRHGRRDEEPVGVAPVAPSWVVGSAAQRDRREPSGDDPGAATRARATTRLRAGSGAGSGPAPRGGLQRSGYARLRLLMPSMQSRRSRRALRISAVTLAAVLLAVAAGLVGLRWAASVRTNPVAVQQLSPVASSTTPNRTPPATGRPSVARPSTTRPSTARAITPRPSSGTGGPPTAKRSSQPATATATKTKIATTTTTTTTTASGPSGAPTGAADWTATVQALDQARSRALVGRDPALLDAVYTTDSAARSADAQTIRTLIAEGVRVSGARHRVQSVQPVAGAAATVVVRDWLPSYDVLGATGSVVGRTAERPTAARVMVLVNTAAGYRISEVRAAGSTAPGG